MDSGSEQNSTSGSVVMDDGPMLESAQKAAKRISWRRKKTKIIIAIGAVIAVAAVITAIVLYNINRPRTDAEVAAYIDENCLKTGEAEELFVCFDEFKYDPAFNSENIIYGYDYMYDQLINEGRTLDGVYAAINKISYEAVNLNDCNTALENYKKYDNDTFSVEELGMLYSYAIGTAKYCENDELIEYWENKLNETNEKIEEIYNVPSE